MCARSPSIADGINFWENDAKGDPGHSDDKCCIVFKVIAKNCPEQKWPKSG